MPLFSWCRMAKRTYLTESTYRQLIALTVINTVSIFAIILSNALVIFAVATRSRLQTNSNILLACLVRRQGVALVLLRWLMVEQSARPTNMGAGRRETPGTRLSREIFKEIKSMQTYCTYNFRKKKTVNGTHSMTKHFFGTMTFLPTVDKSCDICLKLD